MIAKLDFMMGQIQMSEKSRGWRMPRAFLNRWLHCLARYVPMLPGMRAAIHRWRGVKMGQRVFIGAEVFIDDAEPDLVVIEDDVTVIARVAILAHAIYPHHLRRHLADAENRKGVTIRRGAYIGFGAIVLPGVVIGEEAIIGAGTVVTKDVPARTVMVGSTGKIIKHLDEPSVSVPSMLSSDSETHASCGYAC